MTLGVGVTRLLRSGCGEKLAADPRMGDGECRAIEGIDVRQRLVEREALATLAERRRCDALNRHDGKEESCRILR